MLLDAYLLHVHKDNPLMAPPNKKKKGSLWSQREALTVREKKEPIPRRNCRTETAGFTYALSIWSGSRLTNKERARL